MRERSRFDRTRPHREVRITETGFSVNGRDIQKSESTKRIIEKAKDGFALEQSSRSSEPARGSS